MSADLSVVALAPDCSARAEAWAARLDLPLALPGLADMAAGLLLLEVGSDGLQLRGRAGVLRVDFTSGALGARLRRGVGRGEALVRALGRRGTPSACMSVLDATAGLGRDSLLLARAGHAVHAVERHPVVGALVEDALQRAMRVPLLASAAQRIRLDWADARSVLGQLSEAELPDAVYLDPMFPPRTATALVRKEMRLLAELFGSSPPAEEHASLLQAALHAARRRVIVKRPARGPLLVDAPLPDLRLGGGDTVRYDVYLTRRASSP